MAFIWSGSTRSGIEAHLTDLHVTRTYGGLLEGVPNAKMNQRLIEESVKAAGSYWPVHLVEPGLIKREFTLPEGAPKRDLRYDELPAFRCIGHLMSFEARDAENHGAALTIVWFQNQSPVEGIDLQLGELDWFTQARDFCY